MPIAPARTAAFDILLRVENEDAFASELLHSERLSALSPQDRNLSTEIVMGVLRWQSVLDAQLAQCASKPVARLDAEVRVALRIAAYQLRYLTRVPGSAAVNDSVDLVKRARKRSAAPFVNAVLRKLMQTPPPVATIRGAHPEWLVARWIAEYGNDAADCICTYDQQVPQSALRFEDGLAEAELIAQGVELVPGALLRSARRVVGGDLTRTPAFREHRVAVQDEASQLVAALVGQGANILDCCAAPGGKTAAIAQRNPAARIVAVEVHPHRARLLRERVKAANVEVVTSDTRQLPFGAEFDHILVDAPCSGTGTLARNPEIKWKLKPEDLDDLHRRQVEILCAALRYLSPGGRLVYSTCSLEREENESVIDETLRNVEGYRLIDCGEELQRLANSGELAVNDVHSLLRGSYLRTIPGVQSCEGFFAAVLERQ